ncbi:hypothetical protein BT63DRAFT_430185 [Microthyrium microscopicum]|uniref:Spindle pole body component n=1 Tax=Microthyrium microscopicum TaxID=703497 RepID=A0A6A6TYK1_9PEZI|nr:hypothetical protein BT63DRAFT_430185 [Microthyrium microscopicum]
MAFAQNNSTLEDLVADVTKISPASDPKAFKKWRDYALKTTKSSHWARVNQFEVESKLNGLAEKFHILNREDLALGMESSLQKLELVSDKWTPDILFLLLELSDQPTSKADIYDSREKSHSPELTPLSWAELKRDDPFSDDDLWKDVSYSPISSDSEDDISITTPAPTENLATSKDQVSQTNRVNELFVEVDEALLKSLLNLQFWVDKPSNGIQELSADKNTLPELQAVREVLQLLRGLPTSMFEILGMQVRYVDQHALKDLSKPVFASIMQSFAALATHVLYLRKWVQQPVTESLLRAFKAAVQDAITDYDKVIGKLDTSFVNHGADITISLMAVMDEARIMSRPLLFLGTLIKRMSTTSAKQFSHLELIYDSICEQQEAGDAILYVFLANIFFKSLRAFLRPIRTWMEEGVIVNQSAFFIQENEGPLEDSSLWHDQFSLRKSQHGDLLAPIFVHAAAKFILNAGKSIRFLGRLDTAVSLSKATQSDLDLDLVCCHDDEQFLSPFPILFDSALDTWIRSMYSPAMTTLKQQIWSKYQLGVHLEALQEIYLSKDGGRLQALADPIFQSLDNKKTGWNDRYVFAEKVKDVFADCDHVKEQLIVVRSTPSKSGVRSIRGASNIVLDYHLPWPVLNVIRKQSLATYQRVFRFLLQLYRAKYLLRQNVFQRGKELPIVVAINHQLKWLVDVLQAHIIFSVIQPLVERLGQQISEANDLDAMSEAHDRFVSSLQAQCLLSKNLNPIHQGIMSILELVVQLCNIQKPWQAIEALWRNRCSR